MKHIKLFEILFILTLVSCGKGYKEKDEFQEEVFNGKYDAVIKPLSFKTGQFSGWLNLSLFDNQFWARVKINGPRTNQMHGQYIHQNSTCPSMRDDKNHDGYLDFMEVNGVVGPILIPLDGNLNSQIKGLYDFPSFRGNSSFYYYSKAGFTNRLMADLRRPDNDREGMMTKLRGSENLNLAKRVIIIYGTTYERHLPDSVSTFEVYPNQASIPIACGEIDEFDISNEE